MSTWRGAIPLSEAVQASHVSIGQLGKLAGAIDLPPLYSPAITGLVATHVAEVRLTLQLVVAVWASRDRFKPIDPSLLAARCRHRAGGDDHNQDFTQSSLLDVRLPNRDSPPTGRTSWGKPVWGNLDRSTPASG